jgi:hypothetical protein
MSWTNQLPIKKRDQKAKSRRHYLCNIEKKKQQANAWRNNNSVKVKESRKLRYPRTRLQMMRSNLKSKYGITPEQKEEMFIAQGSCCAICKTTEPGGRWGWHIDHCHITGKVRGVVCNRCNIALGGFKDNIELLQSAIDYLKRRIV